MTISVLHLHCGAKEKGRAFLEQYWILNRNNIAIALVGNGKGGGRGRTQRPNSAPLFTGIRKERS